MRCHETRITSTIKLSDVTTLSGIFKIMTHKTPYRWLCAKNANISETYILKKKKTLKIVFNLANLRKLQVVRILIGHTFFILWFTDTLTLFSANWNFKQFNKHQKCLLTIKLKKVCPWDWISTWWWQHWFSTRYWEIPYLKVQYQYRQWKFGIGTTLMIIKSKSCKIMLNCFTCIDDTKAFLVKSQSKKNIWSSHKTPMISRVHFKLYS